MTAAAPHIPVLLDEVVAALQPLSGAVVVDGTFGAGGYSRALLDAGASIIAIDRDPDAIAMGRSLRDVHGEALTMVHGRYADMGEHASEAGHAQVDGVVLDIGISSMQVDRVERGFSFMQDGPLDMRMEQAGETAAAWLNRVSETEIADALYTYGEERQSRRLARAIVAARPIETTGQLRAIVHKVLGYHAGMPKDPAMRTFQALRIVVNDELGELSRGLEAAERLLKPGGRLAVVTFHSLEDRIVKTFLRQRSGAGAVQSRHVPVAASVAAAPSFSGVGKAVRPGADELQRNPRARSATLRAATRTAARPWTTTSGERT